MTDFIGQLSDNQGGVAEIPNNGGKSSVTETLPISWNNFLQGTASHNWPDTTVQYEIDSVAVNCTATHFTVSARSALSSGATGVRYVVFGY